MPWLAAVGSIAAPIAGGLIGQKQASKQYAVSEAAMKKAVAALEAVNVPTAEAQKIVLQKPELVYQYIPEMERLYDQDPSKFESIVLDPRSKEAQMKALDRLSKLGEESFTTEEKLQLDQMQLDVAAQARARDEQLMQELARRGQGGVGAELASRMIASQQAAQQAGQRSSELASMAYRRALDAIAGAGQLGGQISEQEFGQKARTAAAQDAINQFNTANRQSVESRNVGARNVGQEKTQSLKQDISEKGTNIGNQQEIFNKQLIQQEFENQLAKAQGIASAYTGQAQQAANRAANTAQAWGQMGSSTGSGLAGIFGSLNKKES